ncbi:MAG: hypothetical protein Q8P67_08435 [archaeon]|nr:hypothetical protein [archaeon]
MATSSSLDNNPPTKPRLQMLIRRACLDAEIMLRIRSAKHLLLKAGISQHDMEIIDITYDYALTESLSNGLSPGQQLEWPLFMTDGRLIGGVRELEAWIIQGHLGDLSMRSQLRAVGLEKELMETELSRALQQNSTLEASALQHETEALELRLTQIWERMRFQDALREISSESFDCRSESSPSSSPAASPAHLNDSSQSLPSPPYYPLSPPPPEGPQPMPSFDERFQTSMPPSPLRSFSPDDEHPAVAAPQADELPLGLISSAILPIDSVASSIGGALGSLSSYVGSYIWANPEAPVPQLVRQLPSSDSCPPIDFKVVKTNWYNRRQYRTLRFYSHSYSRIDPTTGSVKGVNAYENFKEIDIRSAIACIFKFHDSRVPDEWYECTSLKQMIQLLEDRALAACNMPIPIVGEVGLLK